METQYKYKLKKEQGDWGEVKNLVITYKSSLSSKKTNTDNDLLRILRQHLESLY